jgi:hypothetical protein
LTAYFAAADRAVRYVTPPAGNAAVTAVSGAELRASPAARETRALPGVNVKLKL